MKRQITIPYSELSQVVAAHITIETNTRSDPLHGCVQDVLHDHYNAVEERLEQLTELVIQLSESLYRVHQASIMAYGAQVSEGMLTLDEVIAVLREKLK